MNSIRSSKKWIKTKMGKVKIQPCSGAAHALQGVNAHLCLEDQVKQFFLPDPPLLLLRAAKSVLAASFPLHFNNQMPSDIIKNNGVPIVLHWT